MTFFTYTLTSGSLVLNANDYAFFVSIQTDAVSGSCTILGGSPFKGLSSNAVSLSVGQGVNFSSTSPSSPLSGITITWVAGTIDIIIGF
jgi:hypothetical protein